MNYHRSLTLGCAEDDQPRQTSDPQLKAVLDILSQARGTTHRPSRQSYLIWQAAPAMIRFVSHSQEQLDQLTAPMRQDLADLVEAVTAVLADETALLASHR